MSDGARWVDVAARDEVTTETPVVVRDGRQRIAVLRAEDGRLYAVNDRCPHEGYPLAQGQLRGCTLTCAWHNFKFDLRDGRCLKGDEAVAVYPIRIQGDRVQVDLHRPHDEDAVRRGMERLHEGLHERRLGQVAREVVRLLDAGVAPQRLAVEAARVDAARAEWGSTHALPVATDLLPLLPRYPGSEAALPLMQVFDIVADNHVRRPERPLAEPVDPGDDPAEAGRRLRALVEDEQGEQAEALLRGALFRGWGRDEIEPMLYGPCCDHFLSFGHPLIYQTKVFDLLEATGWEHASVVLPGHLWGIVNATREDTLPPWRPFVKRLAACEERLPRWRAEAAPQGRVAEIPEEARERWWAAWVRGDGGAAFDAVVEALEAGHAPAAIADLIAAAAAARLLRFELAHEADPAVQEGWLDVTHTMTFAAAVHDSVQRYSDPSALRSLFHAARFVNHARVLDERSEAPPRASGGEASVSAIVSAIRARDPEAAVSCCAAYLDAHGPDDALRHAFEDLPLQDAYVRSIIVAHAIKTARVAFELAHRLRGTRFAADPILAFVRFAAAPLRERPVGRLVHEARRLVIDGKVPRSLT